MGQQQKISTSIAQYQQWSGPLPSPESLAKYNAVIPNAAERIMAMAEKEMEHRHQREDAEQRQDEMLLAKRWKLAITSIILGFVCVLVLSALIGYALYVGADGIALGTAIGAIAAVAGLFTYSKLRQGGEKE